MLHYSNFRDSHFANLPLFYYNIIILISVGIFSNYYIVSTTLSLINGLVPTFISFLTALIIITILGISFLNFLHSNQHATYSLMAVRTSLAYVLTSRRHIDWVTCSVVLWLQTGTLRRIDQRGAMSQILKASCDPSTLSLHLDLHLSGVPTSHINFQPLSKVGVGNSREPPLFLHYEHRKPRPDPHSAPAGVSQ